MGKDSKQLTNDLRKRAEAMVDAAGEDVQALSSEGIRELVHELRTHQVELELQNEELRRSEQALGDAHDRLSDLYDFAPVGYATISDKGFIEQANITLADMLGMDRSSVIGKPFSAFVVGEDEDTYYMHRKAVLQSEQRQVAELRLGNAGGGAFWARIETVAARGHDQQGPCLRMNVSDTSTRHLLEEQLLQAQKMEAIGTLVGGIAHEFNNMLAAITGGLHLARMDARSLPRVSSRLDGIEKICFRAADMITHLLVFARSNKIHDLVFDLTAFLKEACKLVRTSIPENIRLEEAICSDQLIIRGDAALMQQILLNLLGNARDAVAEARKPDICVSLAPFEADDDFLHRHPEVDGKHFACLSISDNGCGIPASDLAHLFEPYFTTKEVGKGSGLGLSMVFGAVQMHRGAIEVHSRVNQGSSFRIFLPLCAGKEDMQPETKEIAEKGRGETILLVEDGDEVRETTADVLKGLGYRVITAANGQQGVEAFTAASGGIDLAMLDVVMPELGGHDAAQRMRSIRPELPVIFLSGYEISKTPAGSDSLPNSVELAKPTPVVQLSRTIRSMLSSSTDSP